MPIDPATSRGNLSGQVTVDLPITADPAPGATQYTIALDVANFAADKMVMGQKVEAQALKVNANNHGYQIKGDVRDQRHAGRRSTTASRATADDADVRVQATLDEAARAQLRLRHRPRAEPVRCRSSLPARSSDNKDVAAAASRPI